jgi:hypothetical protein
MAGHWFLGFKQIEDKLNLTKLNLKICSAPTSAPSPQEASYKAHCRTGCESAQPFSFFYFEFSFFYFCSQKLADSPVFLYFPKLSKDF